MFTVLLGAEGVSEIEGQPWIREATLEEIAKLRRYVLWDLEGSRCAFCKTSKAGPCPDCVQEEDSRWRNVLTDRIGRPYFPMTILDDAPDEIKLRAQKAVRVLRLTE